MEYGLQMWSVRDAAEKDLANALKKVAEIGYKYIEFAGFFNHPAEEVKAMLDEYGLIVSGTHSSLADLDNDFAATVKYHKTLGNKNFIIGGGFDTKEQLDATIGKINRYQPMLAAEGITLGYHNHDREFKPNKDGQIPHNEFEARTSIKFEIDTYWVFVAGCDPIGTVTRLKDMNRIEFIHLKDGTRDRKGLALGEGEAPVSAVRAKAIELGLRMIVESEGLQPTGLEEVTRCMNYLRSLEK